MTRDEYVEKVTRYLMPSDEQLAFDARASRTLDGVYQGESPRIRRLVHLAYLRGIRRGASAAWEAKQLVLPRENGDVK